MKIIVSGAAEYMNQDTVWKTLESLKPSVLVVVDSPVGPESLARNWAYQTNSNGGNVTVHYHKSNYSDPAEKTIQLMLNSELDTNAIILFGHDHLTLSLIEMAQKLEFVILTVED